MGADDMLLQAVLQTRDAMGEIKQEFVAHTAQLEGTKHEMGRLAGEFERMNGTLRDIKAWRSAHQSEHARREHYDRGFGDGYEAADAERAERRRRVIEILHSDYVRWAAIGLAGLVFGALTQRLL